MFESGPENSTGSVIFVGGLLDGYHALPYLPMLGKALADHLGFSLIQVMLSSSHMGYGISSLQEDVRELDILINFLREERGKSRLFFIGHSTGCQDAIFYAIHGVHRSAVHGLILQGPVSDREFMASTMDAYPAYLRLAERMIYAGQGQELMVREVDVAPVSAFRFYSLASAGGDDDMFSSDLPPSKMRKLFEQVSTPLIFVHSGRDEYIPEFVDKAQLYERLTATSPSSVGTVILPNADHAVSDLASQTQFCEAVVQFIKQVLYKIEQFEIAQEQSFLKMTL
ncbi:hypothetical protein BGW38_009542 [Lunasporangiospora selenospora]|uniref:Uncharacterized protein n=1 Tax=Lunasporangiospora selenospora TaxID=979761 RepID=A0A9P6KF92_9FUNG|nr:hypothetical protein BGW38_009542 [Lunasporangiospora selenospora]